MTFGPYTEYPPIPNALEPQQSQAGEGALLTLGFVGDLMLGRKVSDTAAAKPAEHFWGDVQPILVGADAILANLESPITRTYRRWTRCWKAFRFQAHPRVVKLLTAANIRFVSLANNHILDCETDGLADTRRHLAEAGIAFAGAGPDAEEAARPALFEVKGVRVGVLSFTNTVGEFAAGQNEPGSNYLPIRTDADALSALRSRVAALRADGARIVVASVHWGPNLRPWPPSHYRRFARALIDMGVDVIHGHSAHILQGVEFHGRGLILYDTGNFMDDYWVFPFVRTDRSCLFLVDFNDAGVERLRLVPVLLTPTRARLAKGRDAKAIARLVRRLSLALSPRFDEQTVELRAAAAVAPADQQERRTKSFPSAQSGSP